MGGSGGGMMGLRLDDTVTRQKVRPGTARRILPYAKRHRWSLAMLLAMTVLNAAIAAASPLLLKVVIDEGILPRKMAVVVGLSLLIAGLAVLDALVIFTQTWFSGRVGQGLVYDLRTRAFDQVQRQPLAFFTRAQTGALVSRLNTDVIGAQQAITTLLTQSVSTVLTLVLLLAMMFYLSWVITVAALLMIPVFFLPGKLVSRRLQRLAREGMQLDGEMGSMMNERFNVSGAMLSKLYGRPEEEATAFAGKAARVRDVAISTTVHSRILFIVGTLLISLSTALVYGLGGGLVVNGDLQVGTLVAMVALLLRLYGPINQLSNMQIEVMTALVSFDRVFEVLDLKPLITERPGARPLPIAGREAGTAPDIEFDGVCFRYPTADEVSLASLEPAALRAAERRNDGVGRNDGASRNGNTQILTGLSFTAPAGRLTALVGPSGAGKTTITHLVPRLYDPTSGAVRIGGQDVRDVTLRSLRESIGVVTQDAHLFHDTIRANLRYARPDASERDLIDACEAARIWDTISRLPHGLDTVVGDRGYRLSGGEKQRVALARLLLKSPPIVVLDEATAHLDSESESAIQRALRTALRGRTSLVIAHRLSTIHEADQILVVDRGRIRERGTHDELILTGGLYAELYRTQFAQQPPANVTPAGSPPA